MCLYSAKEDLFVSGNIHTAGNWEEFMVVQMIKVMRENPNSTLLDIGGNIGFYTLAAAAGFSVNVFEPVPTNAAMIQQSIEKNSFTNIRLHTSALNYHTGEVNMGINKKTKEVLNIQQE
jgi:protein-L-isoaspartate O-methyltransferase